jgi:hypothetical protein
MLPAKPAFDEVSNDIRKCTAGDTKNYTRFGIVGSRFERCREA